MQAGGFGAALSVDEFVTALAGALGWPPSRPARLLLGDRADLVEAAALCVTERAVAEVDTQRTATLLATPAPPSLLRRGRRSYDEFIVRGAGSDDDPLSWRTHQRVILDAAEMLCGGVEGLDDQLGDALGLRDSFVFAPVATDVCKFVGFVPEGALAEVRGAIFAAGAGHIADYSECSWATPGTGTFRGLPTTNPAVGLPSQFEEAPEYRIETVVPRTHVHAVARAFAHATPYEEPAYDVYPLMTPSRAGAGRIGVIAGGMDAAVSALRDVIGAVEAAPGSRSPHDAPNAVVTCQALGAILPELLRDESVGFVVVTAVTDAERELLRERGIGYAIADAEQLVRRFGEHLSALLSRRLRMKVQLQTALEFPGARPSAAPVHPSSDGAPHTATAPPKRTSSHAPPVGQMELGGALAAEDEVPAERPRQLWFDGGSRGNPGPAASAFVIYDVHGNELIRRGVNLGNATNNVAEYNGLLTGLKQALDMGATDLQVFSDSELVVKQVKGIYKVKHEAMKPLHAQALQLLAELSSYQISHVLRAKNAVADGLVNATLDAARR